MAKAVHEASADIDLDACTSVLGLVPNGTWLYDPARGSNVWGNRWALKAHCMQQHLCDASRVMA